MAVTCHNVTAEWKLSSILLGVAKFPKTHTTVHIAEANATLMGEWGISGKVSCMVTDGAANMVTCERLERFITHEQKSCLALATPLF